MFEEIFWRFPHIGNQILCQEASRFIDGQKLTYIRNLLKQIGFSTVLMRKTLTKETLAKLKEFSKKANLHVRLGLNRGFIHTLIPMLGSDCIESPSFNICKLIIDNSEDKNPVDEVTGYSALEMAAFFNKAVVYQLIMDHNENKNPTTGIEKRTPLHLAASKGSFEVCQLILQNIQDFNPRTCFGETPLDIARKKGHNDICRLIESTLQKQKERQRSNRQ